MTEERKNQALGVSQAFKPGQGIDAGIKILLGETEEQELLPEVEQGLARSKAEIEGLIRQKEQGTFNV